MPKDIASTANATVITTAATPAANTTTGATTAATIAKNAKHSTAHMHTLGPKCTHTLACAIHLRDACSRDGKVCEEKF